MEATQILRPVSFCESCQASFFIETWSGFCSSQFSTILDAIILTRNLFAQVMINEEGARHELVPSASWWIRWEIPMIMRRESDMRCFWFWYFWRGGSRWLEVGGAPGPPDDWSKAAGSTKLPWTTTDQLKRHLFDRPEKCTNKHLITWSVLISHHFHWKWIESGQNEYEIRNSWLEC